MGTASRAGSAVVAAIVGAIVVPPSQPAGAGTVILAQSGQTAPGGGTFTGVGVPSLNQLGQVAFRGDLSDGSAGIFGAPGQGGPFLYVRTGDAAPGAGGETFASLGRPALNDAGRVAFTATTSGDGAGTFGRDVGGATFTYFRAGDPAPGNGGGLLRMPVHDTTLDTAGHVAFFARVSISGGPGVFRAVGPPGGQTSAFARAGDDIDGFNGPLAFPDDPPVALAHSGLVAFRGQGTGGVQGIFRGHGPNTARVVARSGQLAPGPPGQTFQSFPHGPAINAAGRVAFVGVTIDAISLFGADPSGDPFAYALGGQPAPGGGAFTSFSRPALNAPGRVAFLASTSAGNGVFGADGSPGGLVAFARAGEAAPGGGSFTGFGHPLLTGGGQSLFSATVSGGGGGLFLADGRERIAVIRSGDLLDGSTVVAASAHDGSALAGSAAVNDFGQVAYRADLADGRQGVFLYTPDLRYRATASGTWDDAGNWTVGLRPAAVHAVWIDPAAGLTVTGPSGMTSVRSLSVGATAAGTTVLDLSAGGSLNVLGDVAIGPGGQITLSRGTLTAAALTNSGTLHQTGGSAVAGPLTNTGLCLIDAGDLSVSSLTNQGEVRLGGPLARITAGSSFTNAGLLTGTGRVAGASITNQAVGEIRASGADRLELVAAGGFRNTGRINLINGGTVEFSDTGTVVNEAAGTMGGRGALILRPGASLANHGTLQFSGGPSEVYGNVRVAVGPAGDGRLTVTGGATLSVFGDLRHESGTPLRVSRQGDVVSNLVVFGEFSGNIAVEGGGAVFAEGLVRPGFSPGVARIDGDFSFGATSTTVFELGGDAPGEYDQFLVSGTALVDGLFRFELLGGFDPEPGDAFDLVTAGEIVDAGVSYGGLTLPDGDWLTMSLLDEPSGAVLRATVVAVPEPSAGVAGFVILAGLATATGRAGRRCRAGDGIVSP